MPENPSTALETPTGVRGMFGSEERLSWLLTGLAGLVGVIALRYSGDYFVTATTGNSQRAVIGFFLGDNWLSVSAALLVVSFVGGVIVASLLRRRLWAAHPHGPTVLATFCLTTATVIDIVFSGWSTDQVSFVPILLIAFGMGALNTSFVKDGQVSIALSYMTGNLVKMGQGIERHISGGSAADWLGYFLLWASFIAGAIIGGCIGLVVNGPQMLVAATVVCVMASLCTHFHTDRRELLKACDEDDSGRAPPRIIADHPGEVADEIEVGVNARSAPPLPRLPSPPQPHGPRARCHGIVSTASRLA